MKRMPMETRQLFADLIGELDQQLTRTKAIALLPAERLLHRPDPEKWNALDVFEHLNLSSGIYLRGLERAFAEQGSSLPASSTFTPGLIGDFSTRAMLPKANGRIAWRMRTLRLFDPARQHGSDSESINRFIALCEGFIKLLQLAPGTDLNRMRVTSSLGPVIRFRAGDAFRFPIAHQQRHFMQIERLLAQH
jgi:hypothetical protein